MLSNLLHNCTSSPTRSHTRALSFLTGTPRPELRGIPPKDILINPKW